MSGKEPPEAPEAGNDAELLALVRPPGWKNPVPAPRYDLVVVGGGTAGLVAAAGAAGLGAKAALVERDRLGGDCLNSGCVPSKALLRSSRLAAELRDAARIGIRVPDGAAADFPAVMERMRRLRARIAVHDAAERFRAMGVDVFLGDGRFLGPEAVEVGDATLRFRRALIATGARPAMPDVPGLPEAGCLTSETVFSLAGLPRRLLVLGAGPVGCELGQAFRRFGSETILIGRPPRLLEKEDPEAAAILLDAFRRDGIDVRLSTTAAEVRVVDGEKRVRLESSDGRRETVAVDAILVGAGRVPSVEGLGLEAAGVAFDRSGGVLVDDFLRTSNPRIYAAGDVCLPQKFTHAADAAARLVLRNAFFPGRRRWNPRPIPRCTFADPEVAHVGLEWNELSKQEFAIQTLTCRMSDVDRAVVDGEEEGFVRIHVRKGSGAILGATVAGRHAGETIGAIAVAMAARLPLGSLADVVLPYPTRAEGIRRAADAFRRSRLTPFAQRILSGWFAWRR